MITGWRLSPSHNLLHTEGHPTLQRAKAERFKKLSACTLVVDVLLVTVSSPPFTGR